MRNIVELTECEASEVCGGATIIEQLLKDLQSQPQKYGPVPDSRYWKDLPLKDLPLRGGPLRKTF